MDGVIVYISISNSDDKLSQADWCAYIEDVQAAIAVGAWFHGKWFSSPVSEFQNACWCIEIGDGELLKSHLSALAADYGQDSIAWAEVKTTEVIGAAS